MTWYEKRFRVLWISHCESENLDFLTSKIPQSRSHLLRWRQNSRWRLHHPERRLSVSSVPVMRVVERYHALSEVAGKLRQGKARHAKSSWVPSVLACNWRTQTNFHLLCFSATWNTRQKYVRVCCLLACLLLRPKPRVSILRGAKSEGEGKNVTVTSFPRTPLAPRSIISLHTSSD